MRKKATKKLFRLLLAGLACAASLTGGCVERRLTINTNPAGAQVMLNDEEIGASPVTTSFNWYGDYNVTIRKDGFQTLKTHRKLPAPWYDYFPFDFIVQALWPGRIVDSYEWSFELQPQKEINRQVLIDQAEQLKQQVESTGQTE